MNWEKVKVSEIAIQIRGVSYKPSDVSEIKTENHLPILRANNIGKYGISFDDLVYVKKKCISEK